jgi:exodeoxyribonuclease VII small subunit
MSDFNFEKALEDLNQIVAKMEQGGLSLQDSLSHFEKGISLTRECQSALEQAQQKVQLLMEKNGELTLQDYNVNEEK